MTGTAGKASGLLLSVLGCLSLSLAAQDPASDLECAADEIDMGEYCARRQPEAAQLKPGARRATPFRVKSMMPGHVGEQPDPGRIPGMDGQVTSQQGASGYGVQLGVFSSRETAIGVARDAARQVGGDFHLIRIPRDQRILWACIHGPFPDEASAIDAMRVLRGRTDNKEAFVKSLEDMELMELDYASTEE